MTYRALVVLSPSRAKRPHGWGVTVFARSEDEAIGSALERVSAMTGLAVAELAVHTITGGTDGTAT